MFKVGSRQESASLNGVSHFIEHLMFKGTKRRPTTKALSKELDQIGAEYNAFTSKDHTSYYVISAARHTELGIDMLSDMLLHSKFDPKEMNRERTVIMEEINMYRDNPVMRIDELFEDCIFGGTPLGMEIGGTHDVLADMPHKDLLAYRNRFYYPGNMVIGVAGQLDETRVMRLINKHFPVRSKKPRASIKPITERQTKPRVKLETKDTSQVQLMLGFPAFHYTHPKIDALLLLSVILGGTMSSRLFINIRERKGLAYSVRSSMESYEDTGYFSVQAGVDPKKIHKALSAIRLELQKIAQKGITREELKRAQDNIRGRLVLRFESHGWYLSFLLSQELLTNRVLTLEDRLAKLDKVTIGEVNQVAQNVINWKKANLAIIGPYHDTKPFMQLIG